MSPTQRKLVWWLGRDEDSWVCCLISCLFILVSWRWRRNKTKGKQACFPSWPVTGYSPFLVTTAADLAQCRQTGTHMYQQRQKTPYLTSHSELWWCSFICWLPTLNPNLISWINGIFLPPNYENLWLVYIPEYYLLS